MDSTNSTATLQIAEPIRNSAEPPPQGTPSTIEMPEHWAVVGKLAVRHLDRFISLEPKVLKGDNTEAIHDIRVASRRLQQLLDLIYPKPRLREIRRFRRKIRRCRRALGGVRNYDVLLKNVSQILARKRVARRDAWSAIHEYLLERRSEAFADAVKKLSKVNLAVLYVDLKRWLTEVGPPSSRENQIQSSRDLQAMKPFPEQFVETLENVWNAFEKQVDVSYQKRNAAVVHGVRIATKRLRYLVEVVHALHISGSLETLAWLRRLQQHLGKWHDLEILEQVMIETVARPDFLREHVPLAMEIAKQVLKNRTAKKFYEEKYFQMVRETSEWNRLKEWVAYLLTSPSAAFTKG